MSHLFLFYYYILTYYFIIFIILLFIIYYKFYYYLNKIMSHPTMLGGAVERRVTIVRNKCVRWQLEAHAVAVEWQRYDAPWRIYEALGEYACPRKTNHQRRLKGNH